jgi:hypothetical protein
MFIMMLVHFFWGGYYVVPLLRCYAYSFFFFFFFYGAYFFIFIIIFYLFIYYYYYYYYYFFFFENHGLGLGTASFRLGIQVGPAMQKNFNLSWKFFQIFRENLGFETCFKFQFGDSLAWMTIQVSNRG